MDDGMGGNLDLYRELAAEEPFNLAPESASSGYPNRFISGLRVVLQTLIQPRFLKGPLCTHCAVEATTRPHV